MPSSIGKAQRKRAEQQLKRCGRLPGGGGLWNKNDDDRHHLLLVMNDRNNNDGVVLGHRVMKTAVS